MYSHGTFSEARQMMFFMCELFEHYRQVLLTMSCYVEASWPWFVTRDRCLSFVLFMFSEFACGSR